MLHDATYTTVRAHCSNLSIGYGIVSIVLNKVSCLLPRQPDWEVLSQQKLVMHLIYTQWMSYFHLTSYTLVLWKYCF